MLHIPIEDALYAELLAPLAQEKPHGRFLKYNHFYDAILEARREEDELLPQGVWKRDIKKSDWLHVQELCVDALRQHTKDLQIALWLGEAWMKLYGAKGFHQAMIFLAAFSETFWASMYPSLEEEIEYRMAPFFWMDDKFAEHIKHFIITAGQEPGAQALTYADWEMAVHRQQVQDMARRMNKEWDVEHDHLTKEKIQLALDLTSQSYFEEMRDHILVASQQVKNYEGWLSQHVPEHPITFKKIRDGAQEVKNFLDKIIQGKISKGARANEQKMPTDPHRDPENEDRSEQRVPPESQNESFLPIKTRAEAYSLLAEAADYLLKTDPHSPTPYVVLRALTWQNMTLLDVLKESSRTEEDTRRIADMLGLGKLLGY